MMAQQQPAKKKKKPWANPIVRIWLTRVYGLREYQQLWEMNDLDRSEKLTRRAAWISFFSLIVTTARSQHIEYLIFVLQEVGIHQMVVKTKLNFWSILLFSLVAQYIAVLIVFPPLTLILLSEGLVSFCVFLIPVVMQFIYPMWAYYILFSLITLWMTIVFVYKGSDRVILFRLFLPAISLILRLISVQ
jgi:hypothetical protein